ncbi:non-ribosomal peptide synthetase [Microtetraspora sp. AC03309]|uniref:condensation domain-containing protein n=1 Tax=Microtetraspora sp. AC03309 TaxID=2779376 RepID=UPI001E4CC3DF|nr:condensation domain-containing protein [Microtetraspora sp. AC03309]MCC5578786.1 non-ribosomal peptide synthetase [Microtetraspora sp. AC03309]
MTTRTTPTTTPTTGPTTAHVTAQVTAPTAGPTTARATVRGTLGELWRRVLRVPHVSDDGDFFALGGDSFRAAQLAALIGERLGVPATAALPFERPEFTAQVRWIEDALAVSAPDEAADEAAADLVAPAGPETAALSTQQEDFLYWMFESEPVRDIGSCCTAIRITDALDVPLLVRTLNALVLRHEALRTVVGGDGTARVVDDLPPEVAEAWAGDEAEAERIVWHERMRLDDVIAGPLVRALVVHIGPDEDDDHVLVLAVHHFAFDGFSFGVLLRELGLVYSAFRAGHPSPLRPLPITYADYCRYTRTRWPANQPYWDRVLDGAPRDLTPFPGRKDTAMFSRRRYGFPIDAGLGARLAGTARARGATPFMAVAACWTWLLAEWTGTTDVVVMSPVPGRTLPEHETIIGCLVQSLLMRFDASGGPTYTELVERVRQVAVGAVAHQFHAYQDARRRVPYPSRIHYESFGAPHFPGLLSEPFPFPRDQVELEWAANPGELDLSAPELIVEEQRDGSLRCAIVYNHYGYDPATVAELADAFLGFVTAAVERPEAVLPPLRAGHGN